MSNFGSFTGSNSNIFDSGDASCSKGSNKGSNNGFSNGSNNGLDSGLNSSSSNFINSMLNDNPVMSDSNLFTNRSTVGPPGSSVFGANSSSGSLFAGLDKMNPAPQTTAPSFYQTDTAQGGPDSFRPQNSTFDSFGASPIEDIEETMLPNAPIVRGGVETMIAQGRAVKFVLNPAVSDGSLWISDRGEIKRLDDAVPKAYDEERKIYIVEVPGVSFSDKYCQFVIDSYKLMCECTGVTRGSVANGKDSSTATRNPDVIVQKYTDLFINLMETFLENGQADLPEAVQVADSLNIVKCLNATRFTPDSRHNISDQFMEWVNTVDGGWPIDSTEEIMLYSAPLEHPSFWNRMVSLVCRGELEVAASSLEAVINGPLHEDMRVHINYTIQLCRSYPVGAPVLDFRTWKGQCNEVHRSLQSVDDTMNAQGLSRVLNVLRGDKESLLELDEPWFVILGDFLKYHDPSRTRLNEYYNMVIKAHPIDVTITWEKGCSEVLKGNYLTVIRDIESLDRCTAVTVTELCRQRRLLDIYTVDIGQSEKPITWLTLSHAQNCLANTKLIRIGVEMLENISHEHREARRIIQEFLPRYDFTDNEDMEWALRVCSRMNLNTTSLRLHRIAAVKYVQNQCFLEAFIEFDRAKDLDGMRVFSWKLFEESLVNVAARGDPLTLAAVGKDNTINIPHAVRECLSPFAVLVEYFNFLQDGLFAEAASNIVALVQFPYIPVKYYGLLVVSALPLLSRSRPRVLKTSDLIALINALDKLGKNVGDELAESGKALIQYSLSLATSQMEPWDWRQTFQRFDTCEQIVRRIRIDIAREISRSYLDGE